MRRRIGIGAQSDRFDTPLGDNSMISTTNVGCRRAIPWCVTAAAAACAIATVMVRSGADSAVRAESAPQPTNGYQTSDARLKTNIRPLETAMPDLLGLEPVRFEWKSGPDRDPQIGLIAQQVQPVVPEAVHKADDAEGTLSISYPTFVPLLIKGVQEHNEKLDTHTRQIRELQQVIEVLNAKVNDHTALIAALRKELDALKEQVAKEH